MIRCEMLKFGYVIVVYRFCYIYNSVIIIDNWIIKVNVVVIQDMYRSVYFVLLIVLYFFVQLYVNRFDWYLYIFWDINLFGHCTSATSLTLSVWSLVWLLSIFGILSFTDTILLVLFLYYSCFFFV